MATAHSAAVAEERRRWCQEGSRSSETDHSCERGMTEVPRMPAEERLEGRRKGMRREEQRSLSPGQPRPKSASPPR